MKSGFLRRHNSVLAWILRSSDTLVPPLLLYVLAVAYEVPWSRAYMLAAILSAFLTFIVFQAVIVYRAWRGASLWSEIRLLIGAWLLVAGVLLLIAWGTKSTTFYSRIVFGSWLLMVPSVMALFHASTRLVLRWLRRHGRNTRTVVIVGCGDLGVNLVNRINTSRWMGLNLLGFFDDDPSKQGGTYEALPVIGTTADVVEYVKRKRVDVVYFALPMRADRRMRELFGALQDTTASVYLVPDMFAFELVGASMQDMGGLPVLALCETPFFGPFGIIKRIEDVLLASCILLLISPLMAVIAICVKVTSSGSILFKQRRFGLDGREIKVYKFRTMATCENGDHVLQATRGDSRVTPFGHFLRCSSLDELPQFFNVLQGRMSVVGPRPHAVAHNEQYRKLIKGYMWRHKVKPGITGWAQVNGWRGETDTLKKMEKRVEYDLEYIRRWSIWLDFKIVCMTLYKGFTNPHAY